jgi:tRNA A-37 threonylcarbamoyl transferase component Bud32
MLLFIVHHRDWVVGRGATSIVYRAEIEGQLCAVKACFQSKAPEWARIDEELDIYCKLQPLRLEIVLPVLYRFRSGDIVGFVLPLVEGKCVYDEECGPFDLTRHVRPQDIPLEVRERATKDLRCIHSLGVLHGDISGRNVLLTNTLDHLYLIDFGRARIDAAKKELADELKAWKRLLELIPNPNPRTRSALALCRSDSSGIVRYSTA